MRTARMALAILATAALALACVGGVAGPAQAAPSIGGCYAYPMTSIGRPSSAAPAIDCQAPHTAETYWTGPLQDSFGLPSKSTPAARLAVGRPCTTAVMNSYLGLQARGLPSRFRTVIWLPTDAQWTAGERWVRCDVVLQGGVEFKSYAGNAAALIASASAEQFNFCTPGEPSARATAAYPCTDPQHNWIKVLEQELGRPGSKFPGSASVEKQTRRLCATQGKKYSGKVAYPGWWGIWPLSAGWGKGKRSAQCFVPYGQYLKQLALNTPKPPAPTPDPTPEPTPSATA